MIKEALLALNEKSGSSPYAIAKYMEEKHKDELPVNYKKILGLQLKNSAARGKLIKIKASYKLSESGKKDKVAATTKPAKPTTEKKTRQTRASTTARAAKKPEPVKKAVKKPTKKVVPKKTKKTTPAKPKSIKSTAAKTKRAKKATA